MKHLTRRSFLKGAALSATALHLSPRSWSQVIGANDDVRVAVVGINGRGGSHISEFGRMKGVRVAALCDVDLNVLERRGKSSESVQKYQDVRKLLENKEIDVVSVATTNHWHSLITIWACQAGKDVYVEKPCSHNVFEGRKCVEAARKYNRIVQHGTQSRSGGGSARLAALVKSGKYGKLLVSKGYCCKPRWSIGYRPIEDPPANLDFDIWLGPAPKQPFHRNLVHYNWHWFWDFGNGDIGNQGVHEIDIARWALGGTLPRSVISLGGRYVDGPDFKDQGQTPNQLVSLYDFGDTLLLFETRGLVGKLKEFPNMVTNELYFEAGAVKGNRFYPKGKSEGEPIVRVEAEVHPGGNFGNFINCVRSRKREELNADILQGHLSSALCHLGNISYRFAKTRPFEKPTDFSDNSVVGDSIMTLLENTKAIGVDPAKATLWVGPKLEFDPAQEKFIGHPEADKFLTRDYRAPYIVPEKV
ncbi:MAG: Gfo/Idh/MocA family oxidoreductase [Verrucomicrobia bacterium]|nr:Gfo/Idh/MocA family oxidoreductase [Verrucomicrobiota bacterium]